MNVKRLGNSSLKPAFHVLFLLFGLQLNAQVVKINCIEPKELSIPIQNNEFTEIHYVNHEGYSFWYKVNVLENGKLSYQVNGIESGASFEVKLFEFNGVGFCKQLVKEQIDPVSKASSYLLKVKKGSRYYLGVSALSSNCGHEITITSEEKQKIIRTSLLGSDCANKAKYERPEFAEDLPQGKVIIGGNVLKGTIKSRLSGRSMSADLQFIGEEEEYEINTISNRLKGFNVHLEKSRKYQLIIKALGYVSLDTMISIAQDEEIEFLLNPVITGGTFIVDNIYFYPNTFACKPASEEALETLKEYMLENKNIRIEIQGHTNGNKDVKKSKNNEKLGQEWNYEGSAKELSKLRADKLKEYLVENGVAKKRITTIGKGGDEMIIPNPKDMEEASKNIRVEIKVTSF